MTTLTDTKIISNKHYWRKIAVNTIIAFCIFFTEEILSDPNGNVLRVSLVYLIGFGIVSSFFAAIAAAILKLMGKRFIATFSRIYSAVIIILAILVFLSVFFK
jgi:hypothetical protein